MDAKDTGRPSRERAIAAREAFDDALQRQMDACEARDWTRAPAPLRDKFGGDAWDTAPSSEAFDAWRVYLAHRVNWAGRCRMNTNQGIRAAARGDLERAELLWGRAISATERFLAELPAGTALEGNVEVLTDSEASAKINEFLAVLSANQGRAIASEALLPAPRAQLRRALEVAYTTEPVDKLAEALIALPLFISDEDAAIVERYLERRAGATGAIGRANWDRAVAVVTRIAGEQRSAMRDWLGISPDVVGVESTIPILHGLATAGDAAALASSRRASGIEAVAGWAIVGIVTLVVMGGVALVVGEPVVSLLVLQLITLVVGVIPALSIFEAVVRALATRDAGAADVAAGLLPLVVPVVLAIAIWLLVTSV